MPDMAGADLPPPYWFTSELASEIRSTLNFIKDKTELQKFTREIACTWLACGLDPNKIVFYNKIYDIWFI